MRNTKEQRPRTEPEKMSWGEDEYESSFNPKVTCDKCKRETAYWNCLINNGQTICNRCCSATEIKKRDRSQIIAAKSFNMEMERLNRRC